ncbi:MAG: uracil-xanthine permease [Clostridia bacterium]|nr:uracil-xanthine permease [Clostridia bacterium]
MNKNLIYDVDSKLPFGKNLLFAFQQFLAIIAATILVPILADASGLYLSQSAALIGAGVGTLVYLAFTKFKSPVFLGSSFAFIAPLASAVAFGYLGIILGAIFAAFVYVVIALVIKFVGSEWINKLMPPVIIGPTVALIGLSLSGSAMNNLMNVAVSADNYNLLAILVGIVTFLITIVASVKGNKQIKMFPFVIGVLGGYILAVIITLIGYNACGSAYCNLVDFSAFKTVGEFKNWLPNLTFVGAITGKTPNGAEALTVGSFADVVTIFVAFAPVALVVFAEHVADHKNISSIIGKDLLKEPGLDKTLLGDGVGSFAGALFGGCPNTTYGESIGCVAITGNASVWTIFTTAILSIIIAFFYPAVAFVETIPSCVVGGICIALYGFIAVSGLRMFKNVDLDNSKNLFIVSAILVPGLGGMFLQFGKVQITSIACALILGIVVNAILKPGKAEIKKEVSYEKETEETMFGTQVKADK